MSLNIYVVFVVVFVVVLVVLHTTFPKSKIFVTAQMWQTLIGALVGFSALALILGEEARINDDRNSQSQKIMEIRILRSIINDISSIQARINSAQELTVTDDVPKDGIQICIFYRGVFERSSYPGVSIGNRLSELAGNVSSRTYKNLSDVIVTIRMYRDSFLTLNTKACIINPIDVVEFIVLSSVEFNLGIDRHKMRIKEQLATLK